MGAYKYLMLLRKACENTRKIYDLPFERMQGTPRKIGEPQSLNNFLKILSELKEIQFVALHRSGPELSCTPLSVALCSCVVCITS